MGNMAIGKAINAGQFSCPPEDLYLLTFVGRAGDIVEATPFGGEEKKPRYDENGEEVKRYRTRLKFRIDGYEGDDEDQEWLGETVQDWFSISLHEKSKLLPFVEALMGRALGDDEVWEDPDDLFTELEGKQLRAKIKPKPNGYPEISGPIAVRKKKAAPPPPPKSKPARGSHPDDDAWEETEF